MKSTFDLNEENKVDQMMAILSSVRITMAVIVISTVMIGIIQ